MPVSSPLRTPSVSVGTWQVGGSPSHTPLAQSPGTWHPCPTSQALQDGPPQSISVSDPSRTSSLHNKDTTIVIDRPGTPLVTSQPWYFPANGGAGTWTTLFVGPLIGLPYIRPYRKKKALGTLLAELIAPPPEASPNPRNPVPDSSNSALATTAVGGSRGCGARSSRTPWVLSCRTEVTREPLWFSPPRTKNPPSSSRTTSWSARGWVNGARVLQPREVGS